MANDATSSANNSEAKPITSASHEQRRVWLWALGGMFGTAAIFAAVIVIWAYAPAPSFLYNSEALWTVNQNPLAIISITALTLTGTGVAARAAVASNRRHEGIPSHNIQARLDYLDAELAKSEGLQLAELWQITQRRLNIYHEIATTQARRSFRNAQVAMAIGFGLLTIFAILAIFSKTAAGSIVTGTLGAIAAGFAAYIGRTFVKSQETAASHLRSYFLQPLEFSRYLAAERIIGTVELTPADRANIASAIVRSIMESSNQIDSQDSQGEDYSATRNSKRSSRKR